MMFRRQAFTLVEILVVVVIIGLIAAFAFPNFSTPTEKARATNAKNNLLAIYTAEKNYSNNNNNAYCVDVVPAVPPACLPAGNQCAQDLPSIDCSLSLNIQDDGTYTYSCAGTTCTATRTGAPAGSNIVLTLNAPIQNGNVNPQCNLLNNSCP